LELIGKLENQEETNNPMLCIQSPTVNDAYIRIADDKDNIQSVFIKQTLDFEEQMKTILYNTCIICQQRRLNLTLNNGKCCRCENQKGRYTFCHENKTLPTWINNRNTVMYTIPRELQNLTIAEKLLIQRVSPLVPVIHVKNGSLGIRGHVVSFFQDISGICNELPKIPADVSLVKVIRSGTTATGENISRSFTVNRNRVLAALHWLKRNNPLYNDIIINETNLSWMNGHTDELKNILTIECNDDVTEQDDNDKGPCEKQVFEPYSQMANLEDETYGCISGEKTQILHEGDTLLAETIRKHSRKRLLPRINWPTREVKPITEYSDTKIFCLAFPWLFPGGVGDIKETRNHEVEIGDWAQNLLFYKDGRFSKDKLWSFFTLNYIQRHRNKSQSHWFVKDFVGSVPPSLDSLQQQLNEGDSVFIDKLMYFGKVVPGSAAYWRGKKAELYSWINHHIERGRGAPNVFMTLSCAEYFWPDLTRLLEDTVLVAEGRRLNLTLNHDELNKALNDYTTVVQEFFHVRVDEFLKTIGFKVFGLKHYWGRFEFAKSRGQIHLHLLGITDDATGNNGIYTKLFKWRNNKKKQARILAKWARKKFNLTAELQSEKDYSNEGISPCKLRFGETISLNEDARNLCMFCQIHKCNDYCMRKSKTGKNEDNKKPMLESLVCVQYKIPLLHYYVIYKITDIIFFEYFFFSHQKEDIAGWVVDLNQKLES
jgi:hypothetical protein